VTLPTLQGVAKAALLEPRFTPVAGFWEANPLCPEIDAIARGSFREKDPTRIRGTGYVVDSLEAALWAFDRGRDFREGCLLAVNLGHDADTTAAVYGQLAGACYGVGGIPVHWLEKLAGREQLTGFADRLYALSRCAGVRSSV
jgi:ADP-ribosyl-[dinitrogen reductase] hydrolase